MRAGTRVLHRYFRATKTQLIAAALTNAKTSTAIHVRARDGDGTIGADGYDGYDGYAGGGGSDGCDRGADACADAVLAGAGLGGTALAGAMPADAADATGRGCAINA